MAAQNKESESEDKMPAATGPPADPSTEQKEKLIAAVKKEVKHLMEEAVTRKFVHEESGGVTALCGAVEACLGQGLRRRALGLFKTNSTTALLHKIAKLHLQKPLVYQRARRPPLGPLTSARPPKWPWLRQAARHPSLVSSVAASPSTVLRK
ncbi:unnamed protein product [Plutella xylostella]|uniref:(diamondback moth) hypothetical protein n=1 Tax=Plutella xylostella TaxID=51655 RepID=A0A8S4DPS1_PLUXY|nr:unnamed protein product [Plutella xylostella]